MNTFLSIHINPYPRWRTETSHTASKQTPSYFLSSSALLPLPQTSLDAKHTHTHVSAGDTACTLTHADRFLEWSSLIRLGKLIPHWFALGATGCLSCFSGVLPFVKWFRILNSLIVPNTIKSLSITNLRIKKQV